MNTLQLSRHLVELQSQAHASVTATNAHQLRKNALLLAFFLGTATVATVCDILGPGEFMDLYYKLCDFKTLYPKLPA